jgi:ribulose-phosphate 3-epimerase
VVLPKIRRAREILSTRELAVWLQVDGGVDEETIVQCADAGADVFVAGSAIYAADDPAEAARRLRTAAERATEAAGWSTT